MRFCPCFMGLWFMCPYDCVSGCLCECVMGHWDTGTLSLAEHLAESLSSSPGSALLSPVSTHCVLCALPICVH